MFNQKGGIGKSSTTRDLAAVNAVEGYRTLLVDLDAQANSAHCLTGLIDENLSAGITDPFKRTLSSGPFNRKGRVKVYEMSFDSLHIVTSSPELTDLQSKLESKYKINKLRKLLDESDEGYDRIYLDASPTLDFYTVFALIAADYCLVPSDCDSFSRQALYDLFQEIEELHDGHSEDLQVGGIVVSQSQPRVSLPQQLPDKLVAEELPVLPAYLMSPAKMYELHQAYAPLVFLEPRHKPTQQFIELHGLLES